MAWWVVGELPLILSPRAGYRQASVLSLGQAPAAVSCYRIASGGGGISISGGSSISLRAHVGVDTEHGEAGHVGHAVKLRARIGRCDGWMGLRLSER